MALIDDINKLPSSVKENTTNHLSHHTTIHAALKDHSPRLNNAEQAAVRADNKVNEYTPRVTALEALSGLSPESPVDGQTANLVAQSGTLTRAAVIGSVQTSSASVSVKDFGALGDGIADDTDAINASIDYAVQVGIGRVIIPDGTYMILGHIPGFTGNFIRQDAGIVLKDDIHLDMSLGATLKCIPNSERQYNVIRIHDRKNVLVTGGRILGERHDHTGTGGEWGYGIAIEGGENIEISGTRIFDCWGDGINIQSSLNTKEPKRVRISGVECNGNRRQGMSVEAVFGLSVTDSTFRNTGGVAPGCGVDIEPVHHAIAVEGVVFKGCTFVDNATSGILAMMDGLDGLTVEDCIFDGNTDTEAQLKTYTTGKNISLLRNIFRNSTANSIRVQGGSEITIADNTADAAIWVSRGLDTHVENVTIRGNTALKPIWLSRVHKLSLSQNRVTAPPSDNGAVYVVGCIDVNISENYISGGKRNVYIFDGFDSNTPISERVSIDGNTLRDCDLANVEIHRATGVHVSGNHMLDCGNASHDTHNVYVGSRTSRVKIWANSFIHGEKEHQAATAIRWYDDATDTIAFYNTLYPAEGLPYAHHSGPPLTTGYVGRDTGVMVGTTPYRPSQPVTGTQYFDVTLGKTIVWNRTEWVNLDGTPLVTPEDI